MTQKYNAFIGSFYYLFYPVWSLIVSYFFDADEGFFLHLTGQSTKQRGLTTLQDLKKLKDILFFEKNGFCCVLLSSQQLNNLKSNR